MNQMAMHGNKMALQIGKVRFHPKPKLAALGLN